MSSSTSSDRPQNLDVWPAAHDLTELIGHTPLIELGKIVDPDGPEILVKHEGYNPGGSIRDRTVLEILDSAASSGLLYRGDEIVMAGATNSALALATIGNARGYRATIFHAKQASRRLVKLLQHAGVTLKFVDGTNLDAVEAAASYARENAGRIFIDAGRREALQDAIHHIAREILEALDGQSVGAFVTTFSTGATLKHVATELRKQYPELVVLGIQIQTPTERRDFYHDVSPSITMERDPIGDANAQKIAITEQDAWLARSYLARAEGLLLGPKGAAAVLGAMKLRAQIPPDRAIVALSIDAGQRYFGAEPEPVRAALEIARTKTNPKHELAQIAASLQE